MNFSKRIKRRKDEFWALSVFCPSPWHVFNWNNSSSHARFAGNGLWGRTFSLEIFIVSDMPCRNRRRHPWRHHYSRWPPLPSRLLAVTSLPTGISFVGFQLLLRKWHLGKGPRIGLKLLWPAQVTFLTRLDQLLPGIWPNSSVGESWGRSLVCLLPSPSLRQKLRKDLSFAPQCIICFVRLWLANGEVTSRHCNCKHCIRGSIDIM